MMQSIKILIIGSMLSLLAACGEPGLDTSSDEAMKASVQTMAKDMSSEEKKTFKQDLLKVYTRLAFTLVASDMSKEEMDAEINEKMDGKTVEEISEMANKPMAEI